MVKKGVHFRLEESLFSALKAEAQKQGTEMTGLVTQFLKQGLGLSDITVSQGVPAFDVSQLEEQIVTRLSQQWDERIDNVEQRISQTWMKRFLGLQQQLEKFQCVSEGIENRLSSHVGDSIEKLEQRLLQLEAQSTLPKTTSIDTQLATQNVEELENKTPHNLELLSIKVDTQSDTQQEVNTQNLTESLGSLGTLPLFNSIDSGEIVKPSKLAEYLNTQVIPETSSKWDIQKLRGLKNKQVSYWKKPPAKRKGEPELPKVINEYLIDWVFSEKETTPNSAGKQWWIQRLPQDISEAEKLIAARREGWKAQYDQ